MRIDDIKTKDELLTYVGEGKKVKYLHLWGHTPKSAGTICKSCFSQWYDSPFTVKGVEYRTAEHYMMAKKAELFGDQLAYRRIIASTHPGDAKKIGREIVGFAEDTWNQHRFDIVVAGNVEKFSQNSELTAFLINTGDRILVEASPVDKIWGIGLAADSVDVEKPFKWQGLNLLGFALMQARKIIKTA